MTTQAKALTTTLVCFVAFLLGAPSFAGAIQVDINGQVVIGDQVFSGGSMELASVADSGLVAIRLNGRQIALAFRDQTGSGFDAHRLQAVLHRDARGLHHLVGMRVAASSKDVALRFASVSRGIATAPAVVALESAHIARVAP